MKFRIKKGQEIILTGDEATVERNLGQIGEFLVTLNKVTVEVTDPEDLSTWHTLIL